MDKNTRNLNIPDEEIITLNKFAMSSHEFDEKLAKRAPAKNSYLIDRFQNDNENVFIQIGYTTNSEIKTALTAEAILLGTYAEYEQRDKTDNTVVEDLGDTHVWSWGISEMPNFIVAFRESLNESLQHLTTHKTISSSDKMMCTFLMSSLLEFLNLDYIYFKPVDGSFLAIGLKSTIWENE